jgi:5-methylthioadenosine/S-adenosylhomocysteine deaminase
VNPAATLCRCRFFAVEIPDAAATALADRRRRLLATIIGCSNDVYRMEHVDLLISAGWVLPVEPHGQVLEQHSVAITQGRIVSVLPSALAWQRFVPERHIERPGHVLLPGLVNTHTSTAMSLLRGAAEASSLPQWSGQIERLQHRWIDAEYVRDGTELGLADMLSSGTTCCGDVHLYPEIVVQSVAQARMRACIGLPVQQLPNAWSGSVDEALDKGLRLRDEYRADPLITTALAPHGALSDADLTRLQRIADELESPVVISMHQAPHYSLPRLERLGMLTPLLIAAQLPQLSSADVELAAQAGISIAHCPRSNLKLHMGLGPVSELLANGVNVALGSGVPAPNNDLDLLDELRTAALLVSGWPHPSATAPTPHDWLKIATLNGARALGLDAEIGSLVPGKWADLCCVNLQRLHSQPVYDPVAQLLYAVCRDQVSDVWVAGRPLLFEGRFTQFDSAELLARAQRWRERIAAA